MEDDLGKQLAKAKVLESNSMFAKLGMPDSSVNWLVYKKPLNPAMLTDLYQFTMMAVYVAAGMTDTPATFTAFYRKNPSKGGFAIACGLESIIAYLTHLQFTGDDIDHMRKKWKMPASFFEYVREFKFEGDVEAVPEGTMVQPYEPLFQVTAPLPIANFIETYVLNQLGFPTLVATKAARMYVQNEDEIDPDKPPQRPIMEFGLRRCPTDAGLAASRAAFIGGCAATSNVIAEVVHDIPAKGTMAHSLVMAFDSEYEAFREICKGIWR